MPFPTRHSYLRALQTGMLERLARGTCGCCGGALAPNGWGERRFLALLLRRCRCRSCRTSFTLLPVFVAPGKWYDYPEIARSFSFVSAFVARPDHPSVSAALREWDHERTDRADDGEVRTGASVSTVRRWRGELAAAAQHRPWKGRAAAAITRIQPDHPVATWHSAQSIFQDAFSVLVLALTALGALLIRQPQGLTVLPPIAAGLWCVESQYRERCLASPYLAGRLIPGPSPSVNFPGGGARFYPRAPRGSAPDP